MTCLRRGVRPHCMRCHKDSDMVDVASDEGRRRLAGRQALGLFPRTHYRFWDPRALAALPVGRRVLWLGSRAALVGGALFALVKMPEASPGAGGFALAVRVSLALLAGVAASALWVALVALAALAMLGAAGVLAQALDLCARMFGWLAAVSRGQLSKWASRAWLRATVAAQRDVLRAALDLIERSLVPRLRAYDREAGASEPQVLGVIRGEGAPIVLLYESSGPIELRDAYVAPFDLEADDGSRICVDLHAGYVETDAPLSYPSDAERPEIPAWTDTERRARTRTAQVRAGARVLIQGGRWIEEVDREGTLTGFRVAPMRRVLRGDAETPALVRVLKA